MRLYLRWILLGEGWRWYLSARSREESISRSLDYLQPGEVVYFRKGDASLYASRPTFYTNPETARLDGEGAGYEVVDDWAKEKVQ